MSPYTGSGSCATTGLCIQVQNNVNPGDIDLGLELSYFVISSATSVTIDGGLGVDKVEFTGDYLTPGASLTVNSETILVDAGVTINTGSADITFNAITKDNGISLLGITSTIPILGAEALIDVGDAQLNGHNVTLNAFSGTVFTSVGGTSAQSLGGDLVVDSVAGFPDNGSFTIGSNNCTYSGRNVNTNTFTGVAGCSGMARASGTGWSRAACCNPSFCMIGAGVPG